MRTVLFKIVSWKIFNLFFEYKHGSKNPWNSSLGAYGLHFDLICVANTLSFEDELTFWKQLNVISS